MRNFKKLQRALDIGALSAPDVQDELEEIGDILLGIQNVANGGIQRSEKPIQQRRKTSLGFKKDNGKLYKIDVFVDDEKISSEVFEYYEIVLQRGTDIVLSKNSAAWVDVKPNSNLRLQFKAWNGIKKFGDPIDYNAVTGEASGRK